MKFKKFLSIVLGCLLLAETPFHSQAASISPAISQEAEVLGERSEETLLSDVIDSEAADPVSEEAGQEAGGAQGKAGAAAPGSAQDGSTAVVIDGAQDPSAGASEGGSGEDANELGDSDSRSGAPSFQLNYSTYTLPVGGTVQLSGGQEGQAVVSWASDREEVASVDGDGVVTALQAGEAVITATYTFSTEAGIETGTASCLVTVGEAVSLDKQSLTLYIGQTKSLKVSSGSQDGAVWTSSNPEVAAVDAKGKVTPIKAGTAQVTVTVNGVTASCKVVVKNPELKLKAKATVYMNSTLSLKATASPKGQVKWKSSNTKVAEVTSKGKVKPKKTGVVTITASCNGVKQQCRVTVKKSSVKLNTQAAVLFEENECRLKAAANPVKELEWISSNTKIAKVDENGTIIGLKAGKAKITAAVPGAKATCEVMVISNNHKMNRSAQKLMKGKSTVLYLKNVSGQDSVSFSLSEGSKDVAKISASGSQCKVTAKKAGKVTLTASYRVRVDGKWVKGESDCDIEVIDSGIVQQQTAVAVKAKKSLTLKNIEKEGLGISKTEWSSSDPAVVQVSSKGMLTGKKEGSATVMAAVSYSDGSAQEFITNVKVSQPKAASKAVVLSLGKSQKVKLEGLNAYSTVDWEVKDKALASIDANGVVTAGNQAGKTEITVVADGKSIKQKLIVTNPQLKSSEAMLATGKTKKMPVTGASSKSKITYLSKNTAVAIVSKSGVIKGKSSGKAKIVAKVDGVKLVFQVKVVHKRALAACEKGLKIINSSRYSQARRMSHGYYDCSSLVFRAYGCDSGLLGGMPSWAPTAASMAAHLERAGKVISYGGLDASKLMPGDLIFYSRGGNGRYRNIYHVSMYYGNGYRLEKPLRAYSRWGNIAMIARPLK